MVGELEVKATRVDVHGLSQNAAGHCRALNVPPWAALSQTEVSEKIYIHPQRTVWKRGEGGGGGGGGWGGGGGGVLTSLACYHMKTM